MKLKHLIIDQRSKQHKNMYFICVGSKLQTANWKSRTMNRVIRRVNDNIFQFGVLSFEQNLMAAKSFNFW